MLEALDFHARTRVIFREGAVDALAEVVPAMGARRVLLVTDPGLEEAGHAQRAMAVLERAGVTVALFDRVMENPTDRCAEAGAEAARSFKPDALVAVGGGSAMDAAKGVGLLLANGGTVAQFRGVGKVAAPLLPLVAVPTTAGTGSEVQSAALITHAETREKMVVWDRHLTPHAALLDPALTVSMPPRVTAATGIDALSHAIESFVSRKANRLSRLFSREAFALLREGFPRVVALPGDVDARGRMLLGAALAGLAIEHSMLGAAHACANPLTHHCGITHGVAVGLLLPHVVRYNGRASGAAALYDTLLAGGAEALAAEVEALLASAGLPRQLRTLDVREESLGALAAEAAGQWTASHNPVQVGAAELLEIYRCAF